MSEESGSCIFGGSEYTPAVGMNQILSGDIVDPFARSVGRMHPPSIQCMRHISATKTSPLARLFKMTAANDNKVAFAAA
jgi:hypothetical protein